MEQDDALDFKALRAKFQDEEMLLKKPRIKPTVPEKPRVVPPPQSPTHVFTLPAGARPSLLTSINQATEGKTATAPRVVFKDKKKEGFTLLLSKKEKSEGKTKWGKDKNGGIKGGKEKPDATEQADLAETALVVPAVREGGGGELVPAKPPPKTAKKKGFLGFRKTSVKKEVLTDPILDTPSPDISPPLIPTPLPLDDPASEPPATPKLRALLPPTPIPTLPDSVDVATTPPTPPRSSTPVAPPPLPSPVPTPPATPSLLARPTPTPPPPAVPTPTPPPSAVPSPTPPPPVVPTPPPPVAPTPTPPPPVAPTPTPPPPVVPTPPPVASPAPSPLPVPEAEAEVAADIAVVEEVGPPPSPPPPVADPAPTPPPPRAEQDPSAATERAEETPPGKKTISCDQRVFNALEKARRKYTSPLTTPTTSSPVTPIPEDPPISPTHSVPELPPIDYDNQKVNCIDHRQASPVLEGIAEEGGDIILEMMIVPPPPPRKPLPDIKSLGPPPEKPLRVSSIDLTAYLPPAEDHQTAVEEIPPPPEFLEPDDPEPEDAAALEVLEFESVELQAPELLDPEWADGEFGGPELLGAEEGEVMMDAVAPYVQQQQEEEMEEEAEVVAPEPEDQGAPAFGGAEFQEDPEPELPPADAALQPPESASSPISQDGQLILGAENGQYESIDDITSTGKAKGGKSAHPKKRKGPPKNPYAETQPVVEATPKSSWFSKAASKDTPKNEKKSTLERSDDKELKKKEKQRLEKEKKEQKEQREREKKEQKEHEKKRNEMKKTFKITGQEEAMYQATVTVASKGRKNDLAVNSGDIVSIIRTTNCPKGKWLAKDSSSTYGYISVSHVELDIKEMLELGKKASQAVSHRSSINETEALSLGSSRNSNHYPLSTGSFSDDSEEWTCDDDDRDDDVLSPTDAPDKGHLRTLSMPEMGNLEPSIHHQHAVSEPITDDVNAQARYEALQKLSTFFYPPQDSSRPVVEELAASTEEETGPEFKEDEPVYPTTEEEDLDIPDMMILPPPDLYADIIMAE